MCVCVCVCKQDLRLNNLQGLYVIKFNQPVSKNYTFKKWLHKTVGMNVQCMLFPNP